ncbi:hypothetical protein BN2476_430048 [Paraburkholderia piptadeniae]|uniref:Uncharacterized protein n=1 Tax=Paraburkholderia piptadeniae TaxID=1701573 RepID=A0A1N7SBR1_9BURK|nr:hypothetical protein BN2476_430048 [Paraburkholderia piptadeniae]
MGEGFERLNRGAVKAGFARRPYNSAFRVKGLSITCHPLPSPFSNCATSTSAMASASSCRT